MALKLKGATFTWTTEQQVAFDTLKACLLQAPILGFLTEEGRFVLDTDASLFAVGSSSRTRQSWRTHIRFWELVRWVVLPWGPPPQQRLVLGRNRLSKFWLLHMPIRGAETLSFFPHVKSH